MHKSFCPCILWCLQWLIQNYCSHDTVFGSSKAKGTTVTGFLLKSQRHTNQCSLFFFLFLGQEIGSRGMDHYSASPIQNSYILHHFVQTKMAILVMSLGNH